MVCSYVTMLILAIDTALDACAAGVLDTDAGKLIARNGGMKRGHAEALMPMIARVMKACRHRHSQASIASRSPRPGSLTGLRVGSPPRAASH